MYKVIIVVFTIIVQFAGFYAFERKLHYQLNPGCNEECNSTTQGVTVVHVTATGPNDTLHYIWGFAGKPTILLALTSHDANLTIDWYKFLFDHSGLSVQFTEKPAYSFGIILNKIVEYNDINDSGYLDVKNSNTTYIRNLNSEYFDWQKSSLELKDRNLVLSIEASKFSDNNYNISRKGNVRMKLNGFGFQEHSDTLPRLLHTANSTVVEIEIDNLETEPTFKNSRFAVEFLIASTDEVSKTMSINVRKSLDDEQSPGVFTLVDLAKPNSQSQCGGFLQWRPVAYVSRIRSLANSTETNSYNVTSVDNPEKTFNNTLLYAFYGYELVDSILVQKTLVSFGLKEDGFYKKTNYTTWTFSVGYGQPPNEDFSLLVILVICIGLGLPALLILISSIVFIVRRITHKQDELCLSR